MIINIIELHANVVVLQEEIKISQHKKSSCHQKLTHYLCDHTPSPVELTVCREATGRRRSARGAASEGY
jgi:hypothetical protein